MRALSLTLLFCIAPLALAGQVHIAVAANFKHTATSINALFKNSTGHITILSSASTGALHSQISHGAPFDVFLAADSQSPARLEAEGFSSRGSRFCYARGQMVLLGGDSLTDLRNPDISLAIANPATAPYGRAAMEVLNRQDNLPGLERKLVRASNVVQAYQFWYTGSVNMALVAQSLSPENGVPIPPAWHSPIEQQAILLTRGVGNEAAESYITFLQSPAVSALIAAAGYGSCQ